MFLYLLLIIAISIQSYKIQFITNDPVFIYKFQVNDDEFQKIESIISKFAEHRAKYSKKKFKKDTVKNLIGQFIFKRQLDKDCKLFLDTLSCYDETAKFHSQGRFLELLNGYTKSSIEYQKTSSNPDKKELAYIFKPGNGANLFYNEPDIYHRVEIKIKGI